MILFPDLKQQNQIVLALLFFRKSGLSIWCLDPAHLKPDVEKSYLSETWTTVNPDFRQ